MYCTQCGTKLPDGTYVCPNCSTSFAPKEEVKVEEPIVMEPVVQEPEVQVEIEPEQPEMAVSPMVEVQPEIVFEAVDQPEMPVQPEIIQQEISQQEIPQQEIPQTAMQPQMVNEGFDPMTGQPYIPQQPKEKKPLLKNKLFLGLMAGGAVLIAAIIIVVILILQPKEIDVTQYVSVEYSGYDGYATADTYLDEWGLYSAILEAKGEKINSYSSLEDYANLVGKGITVASAMDTIELTLSKEENVANGDELVVTITYDNEIANEVDIEFVGESITITAEGLEPIAEVDPFEGLNVTFSGIAPYGYLNYEYTGSSEYIQSYYFTADLNSYLKNGDKVTIKYDVTDENTLWYGYMATVKEKTYEVTGLQEYVADYASISSDFISNLKSETEDTIYAYVANSYSTTYSLGNLEYAGYIFSYTKNPEDYPWYTNSIYIIYKGDVTKTGTENSRTVYYPVCFRNLLVQNDAFSYESKEGLQGYCYLEGVGTWTDGYVNPISCYMDLATYYEEDYNVVCGDGFEVFASYTSIAALTDISAEYKTVIQNDAKAKIEKYIADKYSDSCQVKDLALLGEYLLVNKEQGSDFSDNNSYVVVYSGKVTHKDGKFEETIVYYPVAYNGIVALPGGEYMYMEYEGIKGSSTRLGSGSSSYYTSGYVDGAKMFSEVVTANRERYTYDVSEGLKKFGE